MLAKLRVTAPKVHHLGTVPIVVMVHNTCAPDLKKPSFQCNQDEGAPKDKFGNVTVVDLFSDNGAPDAFWSRKFGEGEMRGLAVADLTQVDCEQWEGSLDHFSSWTKYKPEEGSLKQVEVKPEE